MRMLPYRVETRTGDTFDFELPLHSDTGDPVRVAQLISSILAAVDRDIALATDTGNGDVLQALAMAMAIRARMIHASHESVASLSAQLLHTALDAVSDSRRHAPGVGHA